MLGLSEKEQEDLENQIAMTTKELGEKTRKVANFVSRCMKKAGISELDCGNILIRIVCRETSGGVCEYTLVYDNHADCEEARGYPSGDLESGLIGANTGYYLNGDLHTWIRNPGREEAEFFLNNSEEIIRKLKEFTCSPY